MLFGWIVRKWLFRLCGIAWKNMMEFGRGGACVPARVALQGRIRRSSPAHNACIFGMETPLRERSGGHAGAAPTCFVWVDCAWAVDVVWGIACGCLMPLGWIARKWLFCLCGMCGKILRSVVGGGAYVPARVAPQGRIHRSIPHAQCVYFWYGNAAARTFGRARRHRPYSFVWVDCVWDGDVVWVDYA